MAKNPKGHLCIVLHAHLPFVTGHGTWPHGMDWMNEATAECYVPLLLRLESVINEGLGPKITLSITPILAEQLSEPRSAVAFREYFMQKIEAADHDTSAFEQEGNVQASAVASRWRNFYTAVQKALLRRYEGNLVQALRRLQDDGHIEVMTSAATHGYLPLLSRDECVQAQVAEGVRTYERLFGRKPKGFWLPECGYRPRYAWAPATALGSGQSPVLRKGLEEFLTEAGIKYFIIDSHLLRGGEAVGVYRERFPALAQLWETFARQYAAVRPEEPHTPYCAHVIDSSGEGKQPVAFFTRDPRTGLQVWSAKHGYPGDGWYLDFHKKHFPGGLRYWRITAPDCDLADKQPYEPSQAGSRIRENASHFAHLVHDLLIDHYERTGEVGVICAPYDAELFGHWWFEGPRWLAQVIRNVAQDPDVEMSTCSEYLEKHPPSTLFSLPEGSWGEAGFHWVWLNQWTEWTWRHIYECEEKMCELAQVAAGTSQPDLELVLAQLARELLLLESSDWQFLITTWSARDYAESRVVHHLEAFASLASIAERLIQGTPLAAGDRAVIARYATVDDPFGEVDWRGYAKVKYPAG